MPVRGPFTRMLVWLALCCAGVLAVIGGLGLRAPGLVGVALAGALACSIAVGVAREAPRRDRRRIAESAVQATAWTVGVLLVLAGIAALAGGFVALLAAVVGVAPRVTARAVGSGRPPAAAASPPGPTPQWAAGVEVPLLPVPPPEPAVPGRPAAAPGATPGAPAVSTMPTSELGEEWLRTTTALSGPLAPLDRLSTVGRRGEVLDELERRDSDGFARWLAAGHVLSDPAGYVQGHPAQGGPPADTDVP